MRALRYAFVSVTILCLHFSIPSAFPEEEARVSESVPDVFVLAEEVDVLQAILDLKLTAKQMTIIAGRVEALKKKQEEYRKQEEAILTGIREALQKTRDALASGKEAPASVQAVTTPKLKELQELRQKAAQDFDSTVAGCVQLLESGQIREIARTPLARQRAAQMVQQIRGASESSWPTVRSQLTEELLEVKKLDKAPEWEEERKTLDGLSENDLEVALKDFEERKEAEVAQMKSEIGQLLDSIRSADARILSIGVNRLTDGLRTRAEIRADLFAMMGRILGSPEAEKALKARLASGETAENKAVGD